jgi:hypothetical protein
MTDVIFPAICARQKQFPQEDGSLRRAVLWVDGHPTRRLRNIWRIAYNFGLFYLFV